jgi:Uma2 family endonuclease
MNAFARIEAPPVRHRFTVADVRAMVAAGVLDEDAPLELLDGDLIDMPSEGELHMSFKIELNRLIVRALSDEFRVVPDSPLHLSDTDAPEPDLYVIDAGAALEPIDPAKVRLIIEIAVSSIAHDLGRKAAKYADHGIAEYWVLDVAARRTHVLRSPEGGAYHDISTYSFDDQLVSSQVEGLRVCVADLSTPG